MRPESLPVLKGKCAKEFEKMAAKPLTPEQLQTFQKAKEVYKSIKRR